MKATGTDGEPLSEDFQNLGEKEGKLLSFDPNRRGGSSTVGNGARAEQVDEHLTLFTFEFVSYPEPKILSETELKPLYGALNSWHLVAQAIGASEAFVRQNGRKQRSSPCRTKPHSI